LWDIAVYKPTSKLKPAKMQSFISSSPKNQNDCYSALLTLTCTLTIIFSNVFITYAQSPHAVDSYRNIKSIKKSSRAETDLILKFQPVPPDKQKLKNTLLTNVQVPNINSYKNVPSGFDKSNLRYFIIDYAQYKYEQFLNGEISQALWDDIIKQYHLKSAKLTKQHLLKNKVGIFIGLDKSKNKTVIVDVNNNLDFGDDKKYIIPNDYPENSNYNINFAGSYFNGRRVVDTTFSLLMSEQKIQYGKDTVQRLLGVSFSTSQWSATFSDSRYHYEIKYNKPLVPNGALMDPKLLIFTQYDKDNQIILQDQVYEMRDTLTLNGQKFIITDLDYQNGSLTLKKLGFKRDGTAIGEFITNFNAIDIISQKNISPLLLRGKYIMIDFWGTWCVPCIKVIPENAAFEKRHKDKLIMISIAYDQQKDLEQMKRIIKENNMDWINLWDDINNSVLVKKFKVHGFPMYILIDPSGKILFRNSTSYSLKIIEKLLNKN
jgi:thiol-disulfide isomerase/thioredoxin